MFGAPPPLTDVFPRMQLPLCAAFSLSITDTLHGEDHNIFLQQLVLHLLFSCLSPISFSSSLAVYLPSVYGPQTITECYSICSP